MQEKEYDIYLTRAIKFATNLNKDFFAETREFDTKIYKSHKNVIAWKNRQELTGESISNNQLWGELWENAWFELEGDIPESWNGKNVAALINLGGEVLIFDEQGVPKYNLTNTSIYISQYRKELYQMFEKAQAGKFSIWAEVAANGLVGSEINPDEPAQSCQIGMIRHLTYGVFRKEVWDLRLDIEVLLNILGSALEVNSWIKTVPAYDGFHYRKKQIVRTINDAINVYADNPENASQARVILQKELSIHAEDSTMKVAAVGHAHIDTAWLWPLKESIRKCARTFSGQLALMDKYPNYVFGASQAQHYQFIKEHYPELYEKIKQRIKEGRWEVQGGMWVEADCNLINGESMIRQFVHGKNFFLDEFGVEVKNLWLPDVFGYSAAMPQIIKKANCDHFLTQKISWSQVNKFPYHAFNWQGLDGSNVLTFFPPEDNYNAVIAPGQLNYAANNFSESEKVNEILSLYGIGDGGGGPKEEFLERAIRCNSLQGCPKVNFDRADNFFARLEKSKDILPKWIGELYLEFHRGTFTTQGKTKKNNRLCEQLLVAVEFLLSNDLSNYPLEKLDKLWKTLLLNQFHDIIPGSSIHEVYERTEAEHAEIIEELKNIIHSYVENNFVADNCKMTFVNTLSYAYTKRVELPIDWQDRILYSENGDIINSDGKYILLDLKAQSLTVIKKGEVKNYNKSQKTLDNFTLENDLIAYKINKDGKIVSILDKESQRELIKENCCANDLRMYIDQPNLFEAWDIDFFYPECGSTSPVSVELPLVEITQLVQKATFKLELSKSKFEMQAILDKNSKRLDIIVNIDWQEQQKLLRVLFPTNLTGAREATFDIQYGFVKRPTHMNTSWQQACFESVGQRYCDLSYNGYGVAILNDCKYGYNAVDGCIGLSLLRAPMYPDALADRGKHEFAYSIYPHANNLETSSVIQESAILNRAPLQIVGYATKQAKLACSVVKEDGVALEVIKCAERSNELVIRLNETRGKNSSVVLEIDNQWRNYCECDLLERPIEDGKSINCNILELNLTPFEIKTIKFGK